MYQLEYTVLESINAYGELISDYSLFPYILVAIIIFALLIYLNFSNSKSFYLTLGALILITIIILYFRGIDMFKHFDSIFSLTFYRNIIFYYWNTIFGLFIMHKVLNSNKYQKSSKNIILVFLVILITNVIFSFYITGVVNNQSLLVLGNIYPMVIVGNLISFLLYIYLLVYKTIGIIKETSNKSLKA